MAALTFLIPTTGDRPTLDEAVWCALNQRGIASQVLVCSPIDVECDDPRVRVIRYPAGEPTGRIRNSLLLAADGPVAWLDDDDLIGPDYGRAMIDAGAACRVVEAFGAWIGHYEQGWTVEPKPLGFPIALAGPASLFRAVGGFPQLFVGEDQVMRRKLREAQMTSKSATAVYGYRWAAHLHVSQEYRALAVQEGKLLLRPRAPGQEFMGLMGW